MTKSGAAGTTTLALGPFTNTGVVHVTVGTLSITPFNNNGRAEVDAGAELQATGGTSAGTFATPSGARLNLSGMAMPTGTTFEGSGPVYLDRQHHRTGDGHDVSSARGAARCRARSR